MEARNGFLINPICAEPAGVPRCLVGFRDDIISGAMLSPGRSVRKVSRHGAFPVRTGNGQRSNLVVFRVYTRPDGCIVRFLSRCGGQMSQLRDTRTNSSTRTRSVIQHCVRKTGAFAQGGFLMFTMQYKDPSMMWTNRDLHDVWGRCCA